MFGREEEYAVVGNLSTYLPSELWGPSVIVVTPGTFVDLTVPRISHLINSVTIERISTKKTVSVTMFQASPSTVTICTHDELSFVPFANEIPNCVSGLKFITSIEGC